MATSATTGHVSEETNDTDSAPVSSNEVPNAIEMSVLNNESPSTDVSPEIGGRAPDVGSEATQETSRETSCEQSETPCNSRRETATLDSRGNEHEQAGNSLSGTLPKTSDSDSQVDLNIDSSDASIICRICHMSHKETGEALGITDCECRGGLESVHRSCLIQWVTYKRNNRCELCGVIFPSVSPPRRTSSQERQRRRIESVYQQYTQLRPMTRRKRAFLGSLSLFLVITTSATGILTVSTEREFQRIHLDPWTSGQERMDTYISFSICLSFLLFCGTLTVGVLLIWLALEGSYFRRRERFYDFAQQIARQEGLDVLQNTA